MSLEVKGSGLGFNFPWGYVRMNRDLEVGMELPALYGVEGLGLTSSAALRGLRFRVS